MRGPWADVEGDEMADSRRVILKVTVEVSEEESDTILVREGDDADNLAKLFCERHGLQQSLSDPLANHIYENLLKVRDPANPSGGDCTCADVGNSGHHSLGNEEPRMPPPQSDIPAQLACAASQLPHPPAPPVQESHGPYTTPRRSNSSGFGCGAVGRTVSGADTPRARQVEQAIPYRTPPPAVTPASVRVARHVNGGGNTAATLGTAPLQPRGIAQRGMATPAIASRLSKSSGNMALGRPELESCGVDNGGSRFELLYKDATSRRLKLDRLRKQVEHDVECWHRFPEEMGSLGDRLHRDAAQRQLKIESLRTKREELKRQEEKREATFYPAIEASQRRCPGSSRVPHDPEDRKTKMKIEGLREMKEKKALDGCTFKPEVDHRSQALMTQRTARMKAVPLHEALYDDAMRRMDRQNETTRAPLSGTIQSDIATADQGCILSEGTREDHTDHLAHSTSHSEQRMVRRGPFQPENQFAQDTAGLQSRNTGMRPRSAGSGGPRVLRHMQSDLGLPGGTEAQCVSTAGPLTVAAATVAAHQAQQTPRRNISALLAAATLREEVKPLAMVSTPSVTTIPAPGVDSDAMMLSDVAPIPEPMQAWPPISIGVIDLVSANMLGGSFCTAAAE